MFKCVKPITSVTQRMWNNKSWNSFATSIPQVLHMYYRCSAQRNNRISRCGYVHPSACVARMCTSGQKRQMCLYSASMCVRVWTLSNHHRLSAERLLLLRLCLSPSLSPNKEVRLLKLLHSEAHIEGAKALSPYVGILPPDKSYMVPALPGAACTYSAALITNMTWHIQKETGNVNVVIFASPHVLPCHLKKTWNSMWYRKKIRRYGYMIQSD